MQRQACKLGGHRSPAGVSGARSSFRQSKAVMDGSKAIRGGVPICWPLLRSLDRAGPQHGFIARSSVWSVEEEASTGSIVHHAAGRDRAVARPEVFMLHYKVSLAEDNSLELELSANCNEERSSVSSMASTPNFRFLTWRRVFILGLKKDLSYLDKTGGSSH